MTPEQLALHLEQQKGHLRGTRRSTDAASIIALLDFAEARAISAISLISLAPHGDEIAAAIADSGVLRQLHTLELIGCGLTDAGLRGLAQSPGFRGIRHLSLADNTDGFFGGFIRNEITERGLETLAPHEVRWLDIGGARVTAPFFSRGVFRALEHLGLDGCRVDVEILANASDLATLVSLDLSRNFMTQRGIEALAASTTLSALTTLLLHDNGLWDVAAAALAQRSGLPKLETLGLSHNRLYSDRQVDWVDMGVVVGGGFEELRNDEIAAKFFAGQAIRIV